MAYNRREEDMFHYFISGLDQKMQGGLSAAQRGDGARDGIFPAPV